MSIFDIMKSIYMFISRQGKLIIVFLFVGLLLGYTYDRLQKPYYQSSAIATSGLSFFEGIINPAELKHPVIDQKIAIDMVNALGQVISNKEYHIAADLLDIPEGVAQTLLFVEAEQMYELDLENRRQKLSQFQIVLKAYETSSIPIFQEGLINYFEQNSYALKNYELFKQQIPSLIDHVEQEIFALQDYREEGKTKNALETSSISIANNSNRTETVQNQIVQLFKHKQALERHTMLFKPISFVTDFPEYRDSKNRSAVRIIVFTLFFFLIGSLLAIFREIKRVVV